MTALNVADIPLVSLAKRDEEIYFPGRSGAAAFAAPESGPAVAAAGPR